MVPGGNVRSLRPRILHQLPERADLGLRLRLVLRLLHIIMLKRPVLVRGLVLLVRHRPVPVVLKPHLQQLHLVPGGEAGHQLEDELHELSRGPVRPKRSSLLHQLPERADLSNRRLWR